MNERQRELERIESALLEEEVAAQTMTAEEILDDEDLSRLLEGVSEPAFDDPETIHEPAEQLPYRNFANGYGKEAEEEEDMSPKKKKTDKLVLGLMITACVLCLGIIGVLSYWIAVIL